MSIQVNTQNANKILNHFSNFAKEEIAKGNKGSIAYLFPGHTNRAINVLDKPIFASAKQGLIFRSDNDKIANNYTRKIFMASIAARLGCKLNDLPKIFLWADKYSDLKINDFGKGRPLTARRIQSIMSAVESIESKYIEKQGLSNGESVLHLAERELLLEGISGNVSFGRDAFKMGLEDYDSSADINSLRGKEQVSEYYSNVVGGKTRIGAGIEHRGAPEFHMNDTNTKWMRRIRDLNDSTYKSHMKKYKASETKIINNAVNDDFSYDESKLTDDELEAVRNTSTTKYVNDQPVTRTKKEFVDAVVKRLCEIEDNRHLKEFGKKFTEERNKARYEEFWNDYKEKVIARVKAEGGDLEAELLKAEKDFKAHFWDSHTVIVEGKAEYQGDVLSRELDEMDRKVKQQEIEDGDYEEVQENIY